MYLLRFLALVICLVPMIANSQILDPNFTAPLPIAKAEIFSVKVQSDGKIILAGDFDQYGDQTRNTLIRLNPDGTLDNSFNYSLAGQNSWVNSFELKSNGQIIVSDGLAVHTLESDGTVANTFSTVGDFEAIYTIKTQPDGRTLVAGYSDLNGDFLRRHNSDGSIDDTFFFDQMLYIPNIDLQNDKIIISDPWGMIMRLNQNGEIDETFYPGPYNSYPLNWTGSLSGIAAQPDGKIVRYYGDHLNYNFDVTTVDMIRHAESAESEEAFYDVHGPVVGIKFANNKIYVQLTTKIEFGQTVPSKIIRLNEDGTIDQSFTPVVCIYRQFAQSFDVGPDGSVIVSNSEFDNLLGISKYDASGTFVSAFNPPLTKFGSIKSIRKNSDEKLIVSGNFIKIGNHVTRHVARLMPNGTPDNSFTVAVDRGSAFTAEIASNNAVIVSSETDVFKLDGTGALDESFLLERASDLFQIEKLQVHADDKIIAIGPNNIYRLLPNGSLDPTFASGTGGGGPNGGIPDFAVQPDGKILYASVSTDWDGQPIRKFARINVDGSLDTTFPIGTGPNTNASLRHVSVTAANGFLLAGFMTSFNGRPVTNNLVKVNSDGTFDEAFMTNYEALARKQILIYQPDVSGLLRATNVSSEENDFSFGIDLIKTDGTLDENFHLPTELSPDFPEDIASDESTIFLAGEMTMNGSPVFIAKLLRKSISITGNIINAVAEDTSFELLPEHILIDGLEGDAFDLTLTIGNGAHYTFDGNTVTPEQNFNGTLTISITIKQDSQDLVSGTISIEVTPVNDKPVITGIQNFEILEDQQSTLLLEHLVYSDVDSSNENLTFEISDGENYTVIGNSILSDENYYGPIQLTIVLSDGIDQSESFTFATEVIAVNDAPTILSAKKNQKCSQSSPLILSASNFEIEDIDSDGGFTISAEPGAGYDIVEGSIVPHNAGQQKLMVTVSASDGESTSANFTFDVHVLPTSTNGAGESNTKIWPNPATNVVNHEFKDASVRISNLYGKVVASDELKTGSVDVSHLLPGVYVFEVVEASSRRTVYRFIKE